MTQYYKISRDEFETFLARYDAEQVDLSGVKELVYDIPTVYDYLTVRIYSSITKTGAARDAGADAIRATVYDDHAGKNVDGATRTHRIETWKSNLGPKVADLLARIEAGEFESEDPLAASKAHTFDTEDGENGTVTVIETTKNSYGDVRAVLDGDTYAAKDVIKFDWNQTHHSFNGGDKTWEVDAASIPALAEELHAAGFTLTDGAEAEEEDDDSESLADLWYDGGEYDVFAGDSIEVTYTKKNGNGEAVKTGVVRYVEPDRLAFDRDEDSHTMYVAIGDEALKTSGSKYPFVGTVTAIEAGRFWWAA